jgi:hypothetical protein
MRRRLFALVFSAAALCVALGAVALGDSRGDPITPPNPGTSSTAAETTDSAAPPVNAAVPQEVQNNMKLRCTAAARAQNFRHYWAGESFAGLTATAVIRRCDEPRADEPLRANYVSYIYGDCTPAGDEGCAPPIEVQSWPAVERNRRMLTAAPAGPQDRGADTTVSGVPAAKFDHGTRIEIYHPGATIVVFGDDPVQVERFANALREGPEVLADLGRHGIAFDAACADNVNYCVGTRSRGA